MALALRAAPMRTHLPLSNASRAACTAASTSALPALATVASFSLVAGLMTSNVSPDAASTCWPLMSSCQFVRIIESGVRVCVSAIFSVCSSLSLSIDCFLMTSGLSALERQECLEHFYDCRKSLPHAYAHGSQAVLAAAALKLVHQRREKS